MDAATMLRAEHVCIIVAALLVAIGTVPAADAVAEPPRIEWAKCFGGTSDDYVGAGQLTPDGGYVMTGQMASLDREVIGNRDPNNLWVVKLDATGIETWQNCLGESNIDVGRDVQPDPAGRYIVAGETKSNDVDVVGNHGSKDAWVVKLNATGDLIWQRCLGGSSWDTAAAVATTTDGGYIVVGDTNSNDGDVTGFHGPTIIGNRSSVYSDAWVVKLDATGGLVWQKCLGGWGEGGDQGHAVQQTTDGGYIVAGRTRSNDGDVAGNHGEYDAWIVNLDANGELVWQKCLGGSSYDGAISVQETKDGGYIVAGSANSNDGDVAGNHGYSDMWVVKLDVTGTVVWQSCLGGTNSDSASCIQQTADGGFIVAGVTRSFDGDATGLFGPDDLGMPYWEDWWVVKLNATGNLSWQKCLGGTGFDYACSVQQTTDGGYIVSGLTGSANGYVTGNHGGIYHNYPYSRQTEDAWVVKLESDRLVEPSVLLIPGGAAVPTDQNYDDLYEDVNGNGATDFADVVLYFNQMNWIAANEPLSALDYNGNGLIDFADVVWLFNRF